MKKITIKFILVLLIVMIIISCKKGKNDNKETVINEKTFKIFHVSSYHIPWEWPELQLAGFKNGIGDLQVEYKEFFMDTKRKSRKEEIEKAGEKAREIIDSWKPDLVFTTDDNAQEDVTKYYINSNLPFVFSGVNGEAKDFDFEGSSNVAGIFEREHSIETINFLREIVPTIKRIAVISDDGLTWPPIIKRMKQRVLEEIPEIEIVSWDIVETFEEFKQKMKSYNIKADAVIHLGDFNYKDVKGKNVPFEVIIEWCTKNSRLPDASFWEDRVRNGYLVAVAVSGYEQGKGAGIMAREILVEGKKPSEIGFKQTYKGQPVLNLARAKNLGINVKSSILLTVKVFEKFEWENK